MSLVTGLSISFLKLLSLSDNPVVIQIIIFFFISIVQARQKSRAASVEVLNSQTAEPSFRSRTNSTSTTTSGCTTTTSCLTPNQKVHSRLAHTESETTHRATIEQRPSFQQTKTILTQETEKVRLPPLDSGPIFTRNRSRFGSSLTRYNSDTTMLQV